MPAASLSETTCDWAHHRTIEATRTMRFWIFDTVSGVVVATAALLTLLKWGPDNVWVIAGIPGAVGIVWPFVGLLAIFVWHLFWAPYRQRDALRSYVAELQQVPNFPSVEIEKHALESHGEADRRGMPTQLFVLRRVRITNRDEQKVSLGFKLNVRIGDTLHLGIPNVLGQITLPSRPFGTPPLEQLQSPLDLESKSSVLGNIVFALSLLPEEPDEDKPKGGPKEPGPPPDVELEVSDYISSTSVRFQPGAGYPHSGMVKPRELADRPTRRTVGHIAS